MVNGQLLQKNIYQLQSILLSIQTRICDYMQLFSPTFETTPKCNLFFDIAIL